MRTLFEHERPLVTRLFELAGIKASMDDILVESMADGGMGSLTIGPMISNRKFGFCAVECRFHDVDDVLVSVALNCDEQGLPFEIDVWKVDFSALKRWPMGSDITGEKSVDNRRSPPRQR